MHSFLTKKKKHVSHLMLDFFYNMEYFWIMYSLPMMETLDSTY